MTLVGTWEKASRFHQSGLDVGGGICDGQAGRTPKSRGSTCTEEGRQPGGSVEQEAACAGVGRARWEGVDHTVRKNKARSGGMLH